MTTSVLSLLTLRTGGNAFHSNIMLRLSFYPFLLTKNLNYFFLSLFPSPFFPSQEEGANFPCEDFPQGRYYTTFSFSLVGFGVVVVIFWGVERGADLAKKKTH